jgi:hypothetical protein
MDNKATSGTSLSMYRMTLDAANDFKKYGDLTSVPP